MMKKRCVQSLVFLALICAVFYLLPAKIAIVLNDKGVIAYNRNDFPSAISFYKKSIMICPKAQMHFNLGCAYEKMGNEEQAVLEFEKAIERDPEYKSAYKALADIYALRKDYEQSKVYLKKLESLGGRAAGREFSDMKKDRVVCLYNQGVRFYNLHQQEKALNNFQKVIALDASFPMAYKAVADIYFNQGKLREALRYYKKAVALGLREAKVFNSMGIICMRFEDYRAAIMYFRKALHMDAENLHYLYNLASTLRDSGQFQEALSLYNKVVSAASSYPNVHNDMAGIYDCLGMRDKAVSEYQKERDIAVYLIKTGVADDFTLTRLAVAYNGLNKSTKAEEILNKVVEGNPDYYEAYYARGQVYQKLGNYDKSNADFLRARELAKKNVSSAQKLIRQAWRSGEKVSEKTREDAGSDDQFRENALVYMHNGHVIRGKIKQETDKKVVLEIKTGRAVSTITFHKSKIKAIKRIN